MKNYKIEMKDLDAEALFLALSTLLINKGIITKEELIHELKDTVDLYNEELEDRLKENPSLKSRLRSMERKQRKSDL